MSYCTIAAPRGHVLQARAMNVAGAWFIFTSPIMRVTDGGALLVGEAGDQVFFGPGFWSGGRVIPEPPPVPPPSVGYVEPIT